ncbi:MAG: serine/threonine-protein kinase [Candidatus Cryptobacteroides sp.]
MYGPSGFFADIPEEDNIVSGDLELFRDSPEGFTVLYRCQRSGRFFVYKALKPGYRGIQTYEDLLRKDFEIGFSLQHPNICQYFALVNHPDVGNCIVMEWIDGEDLGHYVQGHPDLSCEVTDRILLEICEALAYLHRKQVIHRDLKPENIMVTFNGLHPKLIDFGLSDADSFAILKVAAGTRFYASPELLLGDNVDNRTDIWSLGIIMQELGRRYHRISSKCLKRDPACRYPNAEAVAADIAGLGKGRGMWLGIAAALVALFVLAGFLGRDFLGYERIGYQADSLDLGDGPEASLDDSAASPDGLQADPDADVSDFGMTDVPDGASGRAEGSVANGVSGGATGSMAAGISGVTETITKSSTSSSTTKSSGGTAIDSTALDALFREAADELEVGE